MKIRAKYTKLGDISYISHLDTIRFMQRLSNRAKVKLTHSEGFSPHPKISFSPALPLGVESICEYLDLEIDDDIAPEELLKKYNENSVDGIKFLEAAELENKSESLMAFITHFKFEIVFLEEEKRDDIKKVFEEIESMNSVLYYRTSKSGNEIEFNMKDYIQNLAIEEISAIELSDLMEDRDATKEIKEDFFDTKFLKITIDLMSSSGESLNLKVLIKYIQEKTGYENIFFRAKKNDAYRLEDGKITRPL